MQRRGPEGHHTEDLQGRPGRQLTVVPAAKAPRVSRAVTASIVVPAIVADAGDTATKRFLEFFAATIRNKNTRMAYYRAVQDTQKHPNLTQIPAAAERFLQLTIFLSRKAPAR